ncbi:MAG: cob(I)yrinic acid a,c-diamide adenosyltransferase [Candidatus Diapherotrites archaeon]|uniref:Cob(I)yrinic acid a,c-diamide adenosyltransferase n=1 Tax=Candidatus Iainarchaeum sp. TaxID=3101447 RepID=A0A8T4C6I4_9ARCH|nr:cob(I)yrinic acid a,c-diamide adenosyltransferase [Candidatus Diapherotrites archaeon]
MGFLEKGLVHVYTGDGKGKTTASLGLALRGAGHGMRVFIVQFMKIGYTGEILALRKYGIPISFESFNVECKNQALHDEEIRAGTFKGYCRDCFVPTDFDAPLATNAFERGKNAVLSGEYDLVVFDELNVAMNKNLINVSTVKKMLEEKPIHTEIVFTGRNAPEEILDAADYITIMTLKKHPYMKNIFARKGIEF